MGRTKSQDEQRTGDWTTHSKHSTIRNVEPVSAFPRFVASTKRATYTP